MVLLPFRVEQERSRKFLSNGLGHSSGFIKPCAFLNVDGFYDDLLKFIQMTTDKGFTKPRFTESLIVSDDFEEILQKFQDYQPPEAKWGMVDQEDLVK